MGGLETIDPRYTTLYERAVEVLGGDSRVVSVGLGGSVAAGTADQWSDLDLYVVATVEDYDELVATWQHWLAAITPTVFARRPIAPAIVNAVTPEGLTLDVVVYKGQVFQFPPATEYTVGMLSTARFADIRDALDYAVAEQLRGLAGPFITFVQRDEHLKHLTGVPHILGLLTTVFLAELGVLPPGKQWNHTYTPEQLAAVAALPKVSANRDDLVAFGLGVAELVVTRARPLFAALDLEWPEPLARVAAERLRDQLGIDASAWLH